MQLELKLLFEGNIGMARVHLAIWREQLLEQADRCWETVRMRETILYGANSSFLARPQGQSSGLWAMDVVHAASGQPNTPPGSQTH